MSTSTQKALPGQVGPLSSNRRDHLRAYLFACVRDNVLTKSDLVSLKTIEKIQRTVTSDLRAMLVDAGDGIRNLVGMFFGSKA